MKKDGMGREESKEKMRKKGVQGEVDKDNRHDKYR